MGDGEALARLDRRDAAHLVDVAALGVARVDMGNAGQPAAASRRIKISVEHAARCRELQLGPVTFPNLQSRLAKPARQFIGAEADQIPRFRLLDNSRLDRSRGLGGRQRRVGGTAGDQQAGKGK